MRYHLISDMSDMRDLRQLLGITTLATTFLINFLINFLILPIKYGQHVHFYPSSRHVTYAPSNSQTTHGACLDHPAALPQMYKYYGCVCLHFANTDQFLTEKFFSNEWPCKSLRTNSIMIKAGSY